MTVTRMDVLTTLEEIQKEFPHFRVIPKPWTSKRNGPTIGYWMFVGTPWAEATPFQQCLTLAHEFEHMCQYRMMGLGSTLLGILPYLIAYCFLPFPVWFAYCRWKFETEAFLAEMRAYARLDSPDALRSRTGHYQKQFRGKGYYWWAWPWKSAIENWVSTAIELAIYQEGLH